MFEKNKTMCVERVHCEDKRYKASARHGRRGFTLIELMLVSIVIGLLVSLLLPALGKALQVSRRTQSRAQQYSVYVAFNDYSRLNNDWYPGIKGNSELLVDAYDDGDATNIQHTGLDAGVRYFLILENDLLAAEQVISPGDGGSYLGASLDRTRYSTSASDKEVYPNMYSYALRANGGNPADYYASDEFLESPIYLTWTANGNSREVIASDRNISDDYQATASIWDTESNRWQGLVLWNDGRVTFERDAMVDDTQYGAYSYEQDGLFSTELSQGEAVNNWKAEGTYGNVWFPAGTGMVMEHTPNYSAASLELNGHLGHDGITYR